MESNIKVNANLQDPLSSNKFRGIKLIARRLSNIAITLLSISFLTSWGLILAGRGREHQPARPLQAAWESMIQISQYFLHHPQTYYWHKKNAVSFQVVLEALESSAVLLLLALAVALILGLALGTVAAISKRKSSSTLIMILSLLGISTPSFLFAMFLWVINIWVHRTFDITVLPSGGFGWDGHMVMPVLVLAMRPLAQIAQITYTSMRDILGQDYIRTAQSKGLSRQSVWFVHILPNISIPTLTTLGASLRFSLASLPIVELFYNWPGVGLVLLDAIKLGNNSLVTDLILSLGLFFLLVNLLIETSFSLIDPRTRIVEEAHEQEHLKSFTTWVCEIKNTVLLWAHDACQRIRPRKVSLPPLPRKLTRPSNGERPTHTRSRWILRNISSNPTLIIGTLSLLALLGVILLGDIFTSANPYEIHGVMVINGKIGAPPYKPTDVFPWGTDHIGRDLQALVLAGGKRTLALAFIGMLARVLLGAVLGLIAGWQRNTWFDRLVTGAIGIWAAFPITIFAMILIQALGIQQGMWVFIVAISVVGWGEVAQFVRGQVIYLKPQLFIESARSVGARSDQILVRHIIPNLINSLIVLGALEMGGVLMLLAELGFLNIYIGGGFRAMIGEAGRMQPVVAFFSDVAEWAALIANIRDYWRSYPWMALYPGAAIFISIITFNMFGEGLRRFLDDSHVNLSRLFNRYIFVAGISVFAVIGLVLQASLPLNIYLDEDQKFDKQRVMQTIQALSSPEMQGRETGLPGAELAAQYIADRMAEAGIIPAGENGTYFQQLNQPRLHLLETPQLTIMNKTGAPVNILTYKKDFTEITYKQGGQGNATATIYGIAFGPILDPTLSDGFGLGNSKAADHIVIVRAADMDKVNAGRLAGVLVVADENLSIERRDLYPYLLSRRENYRPYMIITPELADELLKSAGSNLAELDAISAGLEPGKMELTGEGAQVSMSIQPREMENGAEENYINVIGVIPGQGHFIGLEDKVIMVSAYYDGLGIDLQGTLYPGANDNASGVATMLELARLMKESAYQPDKTVLFVAWAGGERQESLSIVNTMNARPGGSNLIVESVVELSGVGYGTGTGINLGEDSSYRLVKLFQDAASKHNIPTTTRGLSPHYGLPILGAFGGREAMTLSISWDGSDSLAHTPRDTFALIDPNKIYDIGRTTYLTLLVLSRENEY